MQTYRSWFYYQVWSKGSIINYKMAQQIVFLIKRAKRKDFCNVPKLYNVFQWPIILRTDKKDIVTWTNTTYHKFWMRIPLWHAWGRCHWRLTSYQGSLQMSCLHSCWMRTPHRFAPWMDLPANSLLVLIPYVCAYYIIYIVDVMVFDLN